MLHSFHAEEKDRYSLEGMEEQGQEAPFDRAGGKADRKDDSNTEVRKGMLLHIP